MFDPKRAEQLDRIEAIGSTSEARLQADLSGLLQASGGQLASTSTCSRDASSTSTTHPPTSMSASPSRPCTPTARDQLGRSAAPGPSVDQSDFTYCGCQHECFRAYGKSAGKLPCTCTRATCMLTSKAGKQYPCGCIPPSEGLVLATAGTNEGGYPVFVWQRPLPGMGVELA